MWEVSDHHTHIHFRYIQIFHSTVLFYTQKSITLTVKLSNPKLSEFTWENINFGIFLVLDLGDPFSWFFFLLRQRGIHHINIHTEPNIIIHRRVGCSWVGWIPVPTKLFLLCFPDQFVWKWDQFVWKCAIKTFFLIRTLYGTFVASYFHTYCAGHQVNQARSRRVWAGHLKLSGSSATACQIS